MAEQKFVYVDHLKIRFPIRTGGGRSFITPVDDVSFHIDQGEVLGIGRGVWKRKKYNWKVSGTYIGAIGRKNCGGW